MPRLEAPHWLLLAATTLGILGVVTCQLINTWRENKRTLQDAQREHDTHWLDQRVDAYSDFFAAVQDWRETACKVTLTNVRHPSSPAATVLRERCETARLKARAALARVDLFGSESVLKQAEDVYGILHSWSVDALDGLLPSASTTGPCRDLFAVDEVVDSLRNAIRAELGVADRETAVA